MVKVICHGGVNEIGGNKIQIDFEKGSIFLDFGTSYKEEALFFEEFLQPRSKSKLHDLLKLSILPKINGIYRIDALLPIGFETHDFKGKEFWDSGLQSYKDAVDKGDWHPDAFFISHAHADHCGYIPYVGDMPIICSEPTVKIMNAICDVGNLSGFDDHITYIKKCRINKYTKKATFPNELKLDFDKKKMSRKIKAVNNKEEYVTKNEVKFNCYNVDHSIPGSMSCLVESDDKQIVYTGDLRFHGRTGYNLKDELSGLKPNLMFCEGTRIDEAEPDDEYKVEEEFIELFSESEGLAIVGFSWKDLDRYETVRLAASKSGRTPVFDPRLAYVLARLDRCIYDEGASVFLERCDSMLYSKGDYTKTKHKIGDSCFEGWDPQSDERCTIHYDKGISAVEINESPEKYVLHLDYFRFKNLLDLDPLRGSIYIRAQTEPLNPRMELSAERLNRWLRYFEINEDNDYEPYQVHASGHASGPELQDMINEIKPKVLIPIHTRCPQKFENPIGQIIILNKGDVFQNF